MKAKYLIFTLLLYGCASTPFENWTAADTARQAAWTAVHGVDWAQTREIAKNPEYYERNPFLGDHPSTAEVDAYMAGSLAVCTLVSGLLEPKYRRLFQYLSIGVSTTAVVNNYHIGVRVGF